MKTCLKEIFLKENVTVNGRNAIKVTTRGAYSLNDTFLCGQCFRYEEVCREEGYTEYFTAVGDRLIFVGQKKAGELIFYDTDDETFEKIIRPYFDLDADYEKSRRS